MSARLTNEDWNRIVSEEFVRPAEYRNRLRADRAAILESERDLLAALEALSRRYHREAEHEQTSNWRIKSWEKCDRTVCTDARAAIANAHRQDAS